MKNQGKKSNDIQNNNNVLIFDDALPVILKKKGIQNETEKRPRVQKHTSGILSPYIIKIGESENKNEKISQERLWRLAEELITDPELLEEEDDNELSQDFEIKLDAIQQQLQEFELQVAKTKNIKKQILQKDEPLLPLAGKQIAPKINHQDIVQENTCKELLNCKNVVDWSKEDDVLPKNNLAQNVSSFFSQYKTSFSFFVDAPILKSKSIRAMSAFVLLAFIFILPMQVAQGFTKISDSQNRITDSGRQAIDNLMRGASALESENFAVASTDFQRAADDFYEAQNELSSMNSAITTLAGVIPNTDNALDTANGLVDAGISLSKIASNLSLATQEISNLNSANLVTKLDILETYIKDALPQMRLAEKAVQKIDVSLIPEEERYLAQNLQNTLPDLKKSMEEFITFSSTLTTILGQERKMRYLIAFQNNTELRATGGFIGSFAEIDVLNGEIVNIHVPEGGTYDIQGQLSEFVAAPEPLSLINPRWEFHDSNWFPDFAISAQKLLWFYENAGGPTVDGVIAINASIIPDLLAITGPVEMPGYDRTIDSENFLFETQKIVEYEYENYQTNEERQEDAPKQFIGDLSEVLLDKIKDSDTQALLALTHIIGNSLSEKEMQLYFKNNDLQAKMELLGWSGTQTQTSGDYLMVVNTNLGGGKTDSVISQDINLDVNIDDFGTITNTVTITKTHHGLKSTLFEGVNNVDYIRLYVPQGAKLISANGFEIPNDKLFEESTIALKQDSDLSMLIRNQKQDPISETDIWDENGKTVFGNWMQTAPGEVETVSFTYQLPFTISVPNVQKTIFEQIKSSLGIKDLTNYTLFVQKQSGVESRTTMVNIDLPSASKIIWQSHEQNENSEIFITNQQDAFLRFLIDNTM
ncbi:DUF4012 domain-containing protein [Patescibacteria group bacterium]|nr:DUF4012 domain-containing protein [Patescibacteria group bacterium]